MTDQTLHGEEPRNNDIDELVFIMRISKSRQIDELYMTLVNYFSIQIPSTSSPASESKTKNRAFNGHACLASMMIIHMAQRTFRF